MRRLMCLAYFERKTVLLLQRTFEYDSDRYSLFISNYTQAQNPPAVGSCLGLSSQLSALSFLPETKQC